MTEVTLRHCGQECVGHMEVRLEVFNFGVGEEWKEKRHNLYDNKESREQ